jgi:hypothetical protein
MTPERAAAYQRVLHALNTVGPAKLQPSEQERIRTAADTLLFAQTLDQARHDLVDISLLSERLLSSDRWMEAALNVLIEDLLACGPTNVPATA